MEVHPSENKETADDAVERPKTLTLLPKLTTKVNFASAQNGVAIIKSLAVQNDTAEAVTDVVLTMTSVPGFVREKTWRIDRIAADASVSLHDLDTALDTAILGGLDEAEWGKITFSLAAKGQETQTYDHSIEMLARDEWGGLSEMVNLLAAYVSPNQPYVAKILRDASSLLEGAGRSGAIDGYQANDPARVWMVAGAIWSAATALGLSYVVPPASFEGSGQKIRSPERIASERMGTCLDTSLLLAAAFEAAGLNTAVLFSKGHAWVGVWLTKNDFGHLTEPDPMTVRKAMAAREFIPLESTLLTSRPSVGFEQAMEAGRAHLTEAREDEFVQAVDINRARAAHIRPLASHKIADNVAPVEDMESVGAALPRPLDLSQLPPDIIDPIPNTALGRIERWQRKLLDLTLGNRLLNFKDSQSVLPILSADLAATEDRLASGTELKLLALRDEQGTTGRDLTPAQVQKIEAEQAHDALARGQLAVPLTGKEMTKRLIELYRKARLDMAEGGTNTLFLAVGFLRWQRREDDTKKYRAPLLLIPVKLERRSAQSEFRISQFEDEVRVNFTLLEMLKREFELTIPELEGELPRDESGLDIPLILQTVRHRVRDVAGFEVVEEASLAILSFAKYLMWKDLVDRTDSLRQSPLVAHLVDNPETVFPGSQTAMPEPGDIDRKLNPGDLLTPLPADSSQLAAVLAASQDRDFVLIGPPGTGKSQTITNIIADQLGRGKTVLFVAEKSAALIVVHRRLSQQGLADAVLELHSNKSDRKQVLQQLDRSWSRAANANAQDWVQVSEDLRVTRDQLNAYVDALHRPGTQGFSAYQAIGRAVQNESPFALTFDNKDCHDEARWRELKQLAGEIGRLFHHVSDLDMKGPISLLDSGEWSFAWQDQYLAANKKLEDALRAHTDARHALAQGLGATPDIVDSPTISAVLAALANERLGAATLSEMVLNDPEAAQDALAALQTELAEARQARAMLGGDYPDRTLVDIPADALDLQWRDAKSKAWPFSTLAQGKVRKLLQTYASAGKANPETDLAGLRQLVRARAAILESPLKKVEGYAEEKTDTDALHTHIEKAKHYLTVEADLAHAGLAISETGRAELIRANGGRFRDALSKLQETASTLVERQAETLKLGGKNIEHATSETAAQLAALRQLSPRFTDWMKWREGRSRAITAGLGPLVEALDNGVAIADTTQAVEQAYMTWWLRLAIDAEPTLRSFSQWQHEELIQYFHTLDDKQSNLAAGEILRRLGNTLPHRDQVPRKSELGILRHQIGLTRPSLALRSLIAEMPSTFTRLAPCVLMSPLSVAQYLPAGLATFDLVIFDEASQIATWDAVGAIARGKRAIIVGDPKQMPPSNFFGRNDTEEETETDVAEFAFDMPSILEEVEHSGVPTHYLNWHYRSQDEALIAFSNYSYYDGRLVTFPGPKQHSDAVRHHEINGTYLRGKGRTNPDEAQAIAAYVVERLTQWLGIDEKDRPTLGVITFNQPQQVLIEDLLDAKRQADPRLEWFFDDEREEPVIVRNIENIQGDERDVILFSITFGPDHAGKVPMSFGALNLSGGEKRLNVAVTRARQEMHVFTSMSAEHINLERSNKRGVADFKAFLDYVKRGAEALGAQDAGSLGGVDSPFEEAVMEGLRRKGWDVRTQIGVSDFRIDLAVKHPDHAGAWLAGVECDGARYHSSATARDRDRVRQGVLEGLGWKILRVWSTQWFRATAQTLDALDLALRELLEQDREARVATESAKRKPRRSSSRNEKVGSDAADSPHPSLEDPIVVPGGSDIVIPNDGDVVVPPAAVDTSTRSVQFAGLDGVTSGGTPSMPISPVFTPTLDETALSADRFYEEDYTPVLQALMNDLMQKHAPITADNLARNVSQAHGWARTGARIRARIDALLPAYELAEEDGVAFVWEPGTVRSRVPFRGMLGRSARDISRSEIAALLDTMAHRLDEFEDPILEVARAMGIARLTGDTRGYLEGCREWHAGTENT